MEAKALFLRDFSVRRWFCSLGVCYITFSISAAKTRSHFSIVPERRGLREMTGLCQSLRARKIRVTQLHTVPQASPKSPLRNWIHFRGFKARFFDIYSQRTLGTKFILLFLSTSLLHLDWPEEEQNGSEVNPVTFSCTVQMQHVILNLNNYISLYFYFCLFFYQKGKTPLS